MFLSKRKPQASIFRFKIGTDMKKIAYKQMFENEMTHAWYVATRKAMILELKKHLVGCIFGLVKINLQEECSVSELPIFAGLNLKDYQKNIFLLLIYGIDL